MYCILCKANEFVFYNDLTGDTTCLKDCAHPYKDLNSTHCILDTLNDPLIAATVSSVQTSNVAATAAARMLLLIAPTSSGLLLSGGLSDMVKYIRYMDVNYSSKLLQLFSMKSLSETLTDMVPSLNEIVVSKFANNPLPKSFEEYNESSSFLANTWEWLATLVLVFILVLLNLLLIKVEKPRLIRRAAIKIKVIFQWNFCISTFVSYYGSIVFYSSLEFLTASYCKTPLAIASLVLCGCMNIVAIAFFVRIIAVIRTVRKAALQPQVIRAGEISLFQHHHYTGYAIVLEGFKTKSWLQQSYFAIYILRLYLFNTVIVYLYMYPKIQGIIISAATFSMLIYLLSVLPMKSRLDQIQSIIQELLLLVVNISVTILAFLDKKGDHANSRGRVEDIIVWSNVTFFRFFFGIYDNFSSPADKSSLCVAPYIA